MSTILYLLFSVIRLHAAEFLRPVLLMLFCNEKVYSESREIWQSIMKSTNIAHELLSMKRCTSVSSTQLLNSMALMHLKRSNEPLQSLLLLIVSTTRLISLSIDPTESFKVILDHSDVIANESNCSNVVLLLLVEILQVTSIRHIPKLMDIFESLIVKKKLGHPIILNMVLDGIIQFLAYPSFASGKLQAAERVLNYIQSSNRSSQTQTADFDSKFFNICPELLNARDISIMLENQQDLTFKKMTTEAEKFFWTRNQLVLRGMLHSDSIDPQSWKIVLTNLIEISKNDDALRTSLVMPLLFKLSTSTNPRMKLAILQNMIELRATTEIFSTIKALSGGLIRSMSIDLHLRLWKIEPRTYPFLHKSLVEKSSKDSEDRGLEIVRASAIKEICDLRPQHGTDLVSVISEILNNSLDLKEGEIPASLSIDSITLLCQNHVINVVSTWKAISLTTRYEKRPRVVRSLCKFFAIIPSLKRMNLEFENLMKEILGRLWHMIQWSDLHGIKCALSCLKSWNYEMMTLDTVPVAYRDGIALPEAPHGMEVSILDLEVPGECFIQLLTKVHPDARQTAGELLSHYIRCEITEFRSGHYIVKEGQSEPLNYKNLTKQSILKALTNFVIQQATTRKADKLVEEALLVESLRILAQKYCRPLPPLNWCFLHELINKSDEIKAQCLFVAAKQAVISGTAKRLIENFLANLDRNNDEDVEIALNALVDICNGVSPEVLKSFCEYLFKVKRDDVTEKVKICLGQEKDVTNRDNLGSMVAIFIGLNTIDADFIKSIPPKLLDMITFQITMKQKIEFRCEILKSNANVENAIGWISELLTEQTMLNDNREVFFKAFMSLLISSDVFPKRKWLADFIIMMQNRLVEKDVEKDKIEFLLNVFIISVNIASGYFKTISNEDEILQQSLQLLPPSIELVSKQSAYDDVAGKIFEFLLHLINLDCINDDTRKAFKSAIIMSRNHVYFRKAKVWQRFLMIR